MGGTRWPFRWPCSSPKSICLSASGKTSVPLEAAALWLSSTYETALSIDLPVSPPHSARTSQRLVHLPLHPVPTITLRDFDRRTDDTARTYHMLFIPQHLPLQSPFWAPFFSWSFPQSNVTPLAEKVNILTSLTHHCLLNFQLSPSKKCPLLTCPSPPHKVQPFEPVAVVLTKPLPSLSSPRSLEKVTLSSSRCLKASHLEARLRISSYLLNFFIQPTFHKGAI